MRKLNHKKQTVLAWLLLLILSFAIYGTASRSGKAEPDAGLDMQEAVDTLPSPAAECETVVQEADQEKQETDSQLQVHFIDVGQGDSTLIVCDGHAMLIDAGDNSKGAAVQLYLYKKGIARLDYVIGTHPDADHIGGLDVILTKFPCDTIMLPDCSSDTSAYQDVIDCMDYWGYLKTIPQVGKSFALGDSAFTIVSPGQSYEEVNDNSICIRLTHGKNSFLFMGDAQETAETVLLNNNGIDIKADVLKAAHHGSSSSTSENFLQAVSPRYAVISCGTENDYGHPHTEILERLKAAGVKVFRTDEQGSIVATSDGTKITFNCEPSKSLQADIAYQYILNTNSWKFHNPDCESVSDMKEKNKLGCDLTRDEIISLGYKPCGNCHP